MLVGGFWAPAVRTAIPGKREKAVAVTVERANLLTLVIIMRHVMVSFWLLPKVLKRCWNVVKVVREEES